MSLMEAKGTNSISVSVGAVAIKDDQVLMVKITYGPNKEMWMIPGGYVDPGESLEEACIREVMEETGIEVRPVEIIGIRDGVRIKRSNLDSNLYIVFKVDYVSGNPVADEKEVEIAAFRSVPEVLAADNVIELSKEMIQSSKKSQGLQFHKLSKTPNTEYKSYRCYLPLNKKRHP
ncbi:MAG: NUDIX domain-containing protein [Chloroflexota bacterium]